MVRAFGMALLVAAMAAPAVGVELWVSTKGSDDWEGTKKRPFATLVRARDELRGMRDGGPAKAATVWVRGGPYYFEETLTLTAEDTGTAEAPITYRAWKKEEPILVGGAEVTGFDAHEGEIVKAGLKALGLEGLSLGELFYNGARQVLARYPNFDHDNPYAGGFLYAAGEKETADRDRLVAPPEGIREWADPSEGQVWVFPGTNYWNNIVRIASVDPETRVITLANEASYPINPGDRYFVRGFLEGLPQYCHAGHYLAYHLPSQHRAGLHRQRAHTLGGLPDGLWVFQRQQPAYWPKLRKLRFLSARTVLQLGWYFRLWCLTLGDYQLRYWLALILRRIDCLDDPARADAVDDPHLLDGLHHRLEGCAGRD